MDTIDVRLDEGVSDDGPPWEKITLILNGEDVRHTFDAMELAVPRVKMINVFMRTCSCGIAGCEGLFWGVQVKRRKFTVEWRDQERKGNTFPKRFYSFDRAEYEKAADKAYDLLFQIVHKREVTQRPFDHPDEYDYDSDSLIPYYRVKDLIVGINTYVKYIHINGTSWSW